MRVLLFGRYADLAGWRERELASGPRTISEVIAAVAGDSPALAAELAAPWTILARNQSQVDPGVQLSPGDEVAFMPPMSGG